MFRHAQFHDYLNSHNPEDLSDALLKLFHVLNTGGVKVVSGIGETALKSIFFFCCNKIRSSPYY